MRHPQFHPTLNHPGGRSVVSALVSVANALRLLGTEPLFTGIRPEVARTMVELGVDLQKMTTLSTLRAGIARVLSGRAEGTRPARGDRPHQGCR